MYRASIVPMRLSFVAMTFSYIWPMAMCSSKHTLHTSTLHTSTLHTSTLHTSTLHTSTLHTSTLHTSTLHTSTLHTSTLHTSTAHHLYTSFSVPQSGESILCCCEGHSSCEVCCGYCSLIWLKQLRQVLQPSEVGHTHVQSSALYIESRLHDTSLELT